MSETVKRWQVPLHCTSTWHNLSQTWIRFDIVLMANKCVQTRKWIRSRISENANIFFSQQLLTFFLPKKSKLMVTHKKKLMSYMLNLSQFGLTGILIYFECFECSKRNKIIIWATYMLPPSRLNGISRWLSSLIVCLFLLLSTSISDMVKWIENSHHFYVSNGFRASSDCR